MIKSTFASRVGLAVLAAVGVVAVTAPAASAEPLASDLACVFTGLTGQLTPGITVSANVPPAAGGVEQDGLFSFSGTGQACVAVDVEKPTLTNVTVNIDANGTFSNLLAGTGDVEGSACVSANPDPTGEIGTADCPGVVTPPGAQSNLVNFFLQTACGSTGNTRVGFGIDFVGTAGQIGGGACGPEDAAGTNPLSSVSTDSYNVLGAVQISGTPTITNPPVVNSFLVTGAFLAETV